MVKFFKNYALTSAGPCVFGYDRVLGLARYSSRKNDAFLRMWLQDKSSVSVDYVFG